MGEEGHSRGEPADSAGMNDRYGSPPKMVRQLASPRRHLWSCFYEAYRTLTTVMAHCVLDMNLPVKAWGFAWTAEGVVVTRVGPAFVGTVSFGAPL